MNDRPVMAGVLLALGAYLIWGLFPLFWKQLAHVRADDVLAHRVLWSLPFVAVVLAIRQRWAPALASLRDWRQLRLLTLTTLLIASNWGIYIWAVSNEHIVQASQGYFLTPLLNVVFGLLLFGERLRPLQWLAVGLAAIGVAIQTYGIGAVPWVGLGVGMSFAAYGALRKRAASDSVSGLFVETLLLAPLALAWVVWLGAADLGAFAAVSRWTDVLLVMGGVLTAIPLLLFVAATKRLSMSTVGLMFYMTPTLQFLIGTLYYSEPVTTAELVTFGLIWLGLAVFTIEARWHARRAPVVEPG